MRLDSFASDTLFAEVARELIFPLDTPAEADEILHFLKP
jgi:hypothetical protein